MTLSEIAITLEARAAGLWVVEGEELVQNQFWAAQDMPTEVAKAFRQGTLRVSMDRFELGIVASAVRGAVVESIARELPVDAGSGYWLRQFGADRSIAVPLVRHGSAVAVVSVAVLGTNRPEIVPSLCDFLQSWFEGRVRLDSR